MRSFRREESALSEVLGTVLLLAITIVAFAGLAVAVQARLETAPPPPNARFDLLHEGQSMTLVHRWGESVAIEELRFIYDLQGARTEVDLTPQPALNGADPDKWDLGEDMVVICPATKDCIGKGQSNGDNRAEMFLVHVASQTVLHHDPGA